MIVKNYRNDDGLRHSFNELARQTFGIDFETWYANGYWNEKYQPYSVVIENEIVSNVSINIIDCELNGKIKHYVQIGTVMTKKSCRGNGYCRSLIESVLYEYAKCDGFFLFANDCVLDFYPQFGFKKMKEYRYCASVLSKGSNFVQPVSMNSKEDWKRFLDAKNSRRSQGVLHLYTDDLLMFYLTQFMRESVFFIKQLDCYVLADVESDTITLYDVFSAKPVSIMEVCEAFGSEIKKARLAFTPQKTEGLETYEYKEEDTTFFVLGDGIAQDMKTIGSFPQIVHA